MSDNQQLQVQRQRLPVEDSEALFDTAKFEHMARIANMMARATMLPDHLRVMRTESGALVDRDTPRNVPTFLDVEATTANAFLIVNQARLFGGIDPFALAQSTFFVHGRLGFEGKLVQAVLERRIGPMRFENFGEPGTLRYGVKVTAYVPQSDPPREESVTGTVDDWQTKKGGVPLDQWKGAAGQTRMLHYRGTREWARMWAPGLALGLLDEDDLARVNEDFRAQRATLAGGTSTAALPAPARPFNPLADDEGEAEQAPAQERFQAPATPAATSAAPSEPVQPAALASEPAQETVTYRRAPRGTPARVDRLLMELAEVKTVAGVHDFQDSKVAEFLTDMRTQNVDLRLYQPKLEEACAVRVAMIEAEGKKASATAAGADPSTGEIKPPATTPSIDWNARLAKFREVVAKVNDFDALDAAVDEHDSDQMPQVIDASFERITDEARKRIGAALHAQTQPSAPEVPASDDTFPGDLPMPAEVEGEAQTDQGETGGEVQPDVPDMTPEAVQETVEGWSLALRKCKTVADLTAFNAGTITPFMNGPNARLIDPDQLQDVRDTYRNRTNMMAKKEEEAARRG